MLTNLFWIPGPWTGKLAVAPHPRGGDRLNPTFEAWREAGVDAVASLLTPVEATEMALANEPAAAEACQLDFRHFPITDRGVPKSGPEFEEFLAGLSALLAKGKSVVIHGRHGIGRSGLVAACLLAQEGIAPDNAIERIQRARGTFVPDSEEQRHWIREHALHHHLLRS